MIALKLMFSFWLILNASIGAAFVDYAISKIDSKGYIALWLFPLLNERLRDKHVNKACIIIIDILASIVFLLALLLYCVLIGLMVSIVIILANTSKFF